MSYVPDLVRNERVNVGVVVVPEDGGAFQVQLVNRWDRSAGLGIHSAAEIREAAEYFLESVDTIFPDQLPFTSDVDGLIEAETRGFEFFRFSEPDFCDLEPLISLKVMSDLYLVTEESVRSQTKSPTHLRVILAKEIKKLKLQNEVQIHPGASVRGKRDIHTVDFLLQTKSSNHPVVALNGGLSDESDLVYRAGYTSYLALDIKAKDKKSQIAVYNFGVPKHRGPVDKVKNFCKKENIPYVDDTNSTKWVSDLLSNFAVASSGTSRLF